MGLPDPTPFTLSKLRTASTARAYRVSNVECTEARQPAKGIPITGVGLSALTMSTSTEGPYRRAFVGSRISAANLPQGRWRTPLNFTCPLTALAQARPCLGRVRAPCMAPHRI